MSRVIKANYARMVDPEKSKPIPVEKEKPPLPSESVDEDAPFIPMDGAEEQKDDVQSAYEDLLAAAQDEVAHMMEDAQRAAREITDEAARDAEAIAEQAAAQGYEEGFAQGLQEGKQAVRQEAESLFQKAQQDINNTLNDAYVQRDRLMEEAEPRILRLSLDIARKILGYELEENQEAYMGIVKEAVASLAGETQVTLHVSSADFMRAFDSRETIQIPAPQGTVTTHLKIDPAAQPGGMVVETETGTMDISAEAQLEQIALNLGVDQNE